MKITIEGKQIKISHFVNYLVENYNKKGESYKFELIVEDKYDKLFINKRESSLNKKVLILHDDGFDIFQKEIQSNYDNFKTALEDLIDKKELEEKFTQENFSESFIKYKLTVKDETNKKEFSFDFLDLIN